MYERGQLVELVDTSLNGDYNDEGAQKFLRLA